jgi:hypothetical protein
VPVFVLAPASWFLWRRMRAGIAPR